MYPNIYNNQPVLLFKITAQVASFSANPPISGSRRPPLWVPWSYLRMPGQCGLEDHPKTCKWSITIPSLPNTF